MTTFYYRDVNDKAHSFKSESAAKIAATAYAKRMGIRDLIVYQAAWHGQPGGDGRKRVTVKGKRNPAMLGGSVLSRSKASLAGGYLSLVKSAKAKGRKRLSARPKRSVEHSSRKSNSNSVLKTVSFKQPRGGKLEVVAGLTTNEAKKLSDQLRNYGLQGVSVS